jgi:2-succinyl-6-hydroxy-2,4-cyclohexadiene-1-carboxylate synthase
VSALSTAPPLAERSVELRGLAYRCRVGGDERAPAVVLLHGFGGSGDDWSPLAGNLVAAGYRVVAPDLPGHGGTPAPRAYGLERFGAEETGRDLDALLDRLAIGAAHWVGYSMGGRLALVAALAAPGRVATLTLEGTSPGIAGAADREERRGADEALAEAIEARGVAWFAETWEALPIFASQRTLPPGVRAGLAARRRRNDAAGLADSLRAAGQGAQPYVGERLTSLERPTLLITGAHDTKYTILAATMAAAFPSALHVTIPDAGHNVHLEQPEWYARVLLTHLRRCGGDAAASDS